MTIGSVFALVASRRIGLRQRMLAQAEIGAVDIGELRHLISAIAKITIAVEASIASILFIHLATDDGIGSAEAAYSGIFTASRRSTTPASRSTPTASPSSRTTRSSCSRSPLAFIIGGLGFPVLVEFRRRVRPRRWSLHTRITVIATVVLLVIGPLSVLVLEWTNPATLGPMGVWDKMQAAWFQGVTPRTAGFNTIQIGSDARADAEHHHRPDVHRRRSGLDERRHQGDDLRRARVRDVVGGARRPGRQRVPTGVSRSACPAGDDRRPALGRRRVLDRDRADAISPFTFTQTSFEAASAFGTVGLSTGITNALPTVGQILLVVVMLAGRVGPITFVTALALRQRQRAYRYPEERPIIG